MRRNDNRISKQLVIQQGRYDHARWMKLAKHCTRKLRTYLDHVIRDLRRRVPEPDAKDRFNEGGHDRR